MGILKVIISIICIFLMEMFATDPKFNKSTNNKAYSVFEITMGMLFAAWIISGAW